jgi:uncharacterized protein (DUF433 family)
MPYTCYRDGYRSALFIQGLRVGTLTGRLSVRPEPVPLAADADGAVRVGGTRVTLDLVVHAFDEGASPEEVAQRHPTLDLADVYAVFAYYLRHRSEVQTYLLERRRRAEGVRRENERRFPPEGVRERLLARQRGNPERR